MKKDAPDSANFVFVENVHAPEFFTTGVGGFFLSQGNVHITFITPRVSYDPKNPGVGQVVNLRLVMPIASAEWLANGLQDFINTQLTPSPPLSTGPKKGA